MRLWGSPERRYRVDDLTQDAWRELLVGADRDLYRRAEAVAAVGVQRESPVAVQALDRIGALYAVEKEIRGRPPDERRAVRQERSRPLLDDLRTWFEQTLATLSQKSATAKAIRYVLSRWEALGRYCEDGRVEIDNNAAERALRCVALGRKNFLFAGSDAGGDRAAAFYSLIGTAKLNGHNPEAFLREVLTRIAEHPILEVAELLPWNMEPELSASKAREYAPALSATA